MGAFASKPMKYVVKKFVVCFFFLVVVFGSRIYQNHIVQCPRNKAILRKVKLWLDANHRFVYDGFYPLTTFSVLKIVHENCF